MKSDMQAALIASCVLLLVVAIGGLLCCLCRHTQLSTTVQLVGLSGAVTQAVTNVIVWASTSSGNLALLLNNHIFSHMLHISHYFLNHTFHRETPVCLAASLSVTYRAISVPGQCYWYRRDDRFHSLIGCMLPLLFEGFHLLTALLCFAHWFSGWPLLCYQTLFNPFPPHWYPFTSAGWWWFKIWFPSHIFL